MSRERPLSIGLFTYSTKPRGSVVHAACLAEALTRAGHAVTLYALSKAGDGFFRKLCCKVELFEAREAPSNPDELIRQRVREFEHGLHGAALRHDIHHAQDCLAATALLGARGRGIRHMVRTVHHVERFESPYLAECQRRSIEQAELLLSVSRCTERDVWSEFGRPTQRVSNGVDYARFARVKPELGAGIRARFGVAPDARLILSVGGVEERKNTLRALEAVAPLLARDPHLYWLIVGGASIWGHDAYRASFESRLAALPAEIRGRVLLPGSVADDELTALYQRSDVLLCPSAHEGFGLCVLEALAAGTPVVASDREPFTEYLDSSCARLVDPESVDAIANAVWSLLGDAGARRALSAAGQARALGFSWASSADAHLRHYRALLGRTAKRAASRTSHA